MTTNNSIKVKARRVGEGNRMAIKSVGNRRADASSENTPRPRGPEQHHPEDNWQDRALFQSLDCFPQLASIRAAINLPFLPHHDLACKAVLWVFVSVQARHSMRAGGEDCPSRMALTRMLHKGTG
jgi:hypothetical protein